MSLIICDKGPRTHGNVFLRFCIVSSNELVVLDSLENSRQYKKAGKRFRVHGAKDTLAVFDKFLPGFYTRSIFKIFTSMNLRNGLFLKPFNKLAVPVLSGIKHSCSFIKQYFSFQNNN